MTPTGRKMPEFRGFHGKIETAPKSAGHTNRGLTRFIDSTDRRATAMVPKLCSIEDCDSPHMARGWCNKHYKRWKNFGDPFGGVHAHTPERYEAKFWAQVEKTPTCWNWTAGATTGGYGLTLKAKNVKAYAHRWAYELCVGPIPEGMQIDHRCHNTRCVNPAHLRVVTQKQNNENYRGPQARNRSGVMGVHWVKGSNRFLVQVHHNNKNHYGGMYGSIEEAEQAAIALRLKLHTHNDRDRGITKEKLSELANLPAPDQIIGGKQ